MNWQTFLFCHAYFYISWFNWIYFTILIVSIIIVFIDFTHKSFWLPFSIRLCRFLIGINLSFLKFRQSRLFLLFLFVNFNLRFFNLLIKFTFFGYDWHKIANYLLLYLFSLPFIPDLSFIKKQSFQISISNISWK